MKMKKVNEKIFLFVISTVVSFFGIGKELFESMYLNKVVGEQRNILIAFAHDYFEQEINYDFTEKNYNSILSAATKKYILNTVSSDFIYQIYYQTLGIEVPGTIEDLLFFADKYKDSSYVLDYYCLNDILCDKNIFDEDKDVLASNIFSKWMKIIKPGDIFVVTDHVMLIDNVDKDNDVITIIESDDNYYSKNIEKYDNILSINKIDLEKRLLFYLNNSNQIALIRPTNNGNEYMDQDGNIKFYNGVNDIVKLKYFEINK